MTEKFNPGKAPFEFVQEDKKVWSALDQIVNGRSTLDKLILALERQKEEEK